MDSKRYFIYVKRIGSKQYTHTKESFINLEEAKKQAETYKAEGKYKKVNIEKNIFIQASWNYGKECGDRVFI
jgi:L-fucose isomerase-like protein